MARPRAVPRAGRKYTVPACRFFLNSQGDAFRRGRPVARLRPANPSEEAAVRLWERLRSRFRNRPGDQVSETQVYGCWLPSALVDGEGVVRIRLACEFSSRGNAFQPREEGPGRAKVRQAVTVLAQKVRTAFPVLQVIVYERERGYFEVWLMADEGQAEEVYRAAVAVAPIIARSPLKEVHEWIG